MGGPYSSLLVDSICDWWTLAGVDTLVGEETASWLAPPPPITVAETAPAPTENIKPVADITPFARVDNSPAKPDIPAIIAMPTDWDDFQSWLATDAHVPGSQWDSRRVLPVGAAQSPLMLLTAWPEMDDQREGALFTGATGKLLDAMLRAIGQTRADAYIASLAVTRPPGGRCSEQEMADLQRLLWHHLRLAQPAQILLIGNDITRMMTGGSRSDARGNLLNINQDGVKVTGVAVAQPATLLSRPAQKAAAWDSLKLLKRER